MRNIISHMDTIQNRSGRGLLGRLALALTLSLGSLATASGCAEPEEINRVQPDLIKKSDLAGEWYSMGTVVRTNFASASVFPGLQGSLERGVWEVERANLVFYRTYESVEGADSQGIRSDVDTPLLGADGKPVVYDKTLPDSTVVQATRYVYRAAPIKKYAIVGHYDVRRQYNTMTGEESNVVVEDASEKFWYERDYMRVDFGTNIAVNFADMAFGQALPTNVTLYEGEEAPEDLRTRVSPEYMDFVVRGFVQAPTEYFEGFGWVPTCLFYPFFTGGYYECDEEEVHIRTSFMKVPNQNSYKPLDWNDHLMNKFGFYRSARSDYDERYGETWSGADRYIRRFRVWKEYVETDGKLDYTKMEPNPVVYYLSENFPRELVRGAIDLANQWNEPFLEVVETRMGKDYKVTLADGTEADGRMFVLCENSQAEAEAALAADPNALVAETNAFWCKEMGEKKRMGDLRYNLLYSVNEPVQFGLYGYGPMHSDPITGETVHANAFQYTANLRLGARTAVDMIEYVSGVQNFRDITEARHIETELRAQRLSGTQGAPRRGSSDASAYVSEAAGVVGADVAAQMAGAGFAATDVDIATSRMNRLVGSDEYSYLWLNEDMAAMVGMPIEQLGTVSGPNAKVLDTFTNPANLGSERMLSWKMEQDLERGTQAICMREFFDDSFRGVALEYKAKYDTAICERIKAEMDAGADLVFDFNVFSKPSSTRCDDDASVCGNNQVCQFLDQGEVSGSYCVTPCSAGALFDQLRKEIRRVNQVSQFTYWDPNALYTDTKEARVSASQLVARQIVEEIREETFVDVFDRMWSTVAMHEAGHNVGLRHNFASSTDALNFFPKYWELKGADDNGEWKPRALFETDTESQTVNKMREYQQTSIMEYSSSFNARFQGLGSYDRAAILAGYGELVEVFENPPAFDSWSKYLDDPINENPDQFPVETRRVQPLAKALEKVHHTNYPQLFGGVDNILNRRVVDIHEGADLTRPCNQHDSPYDTAICGAGSFCQPFPEGFFCTKPDVVEVPFRFCSDEYNWTTPSCQTWDEGVDPFEIINNSIADYEAYWPFWAYKRDNDLFNPGTSYWGRVVYEMYGYRKQFEHWALSYARYNHNDWWEKRFGKPWHLDENGGLGATIAAKQIFEHLANIFGRPSDGYYGFNRDRLVYEPVVDNGSNQYTNIFQIREDQGARPIYPSYDFSGYIYTPYRAGTFYDRLAALMYMSYPTTMFTVAVDRIYDTKRFRLNFASVWPQRVHNLFSGIIAGRPDMYGWCVEHDGVSPAQGGNGDPLGVKKRLWFGTAEELDAWYANCEPLDPEPLYDFPTTQYRLPAIAAIYGFGWMSGTYDKSFIDRNRMWLEGDGSDVSIPAGFEVVTHTDPFSGKVYVASYDPREEDPTENLEIRELIPADDFETQSVKFWPAARMVVEANRRLEVLIQTNDADSERRYKEIVGRLEILRGLYRYFDFGF